MHFPKYWAKGVWRGRDRAGDAITREAWGWSDTSESDARVRAEERARKIGERADAPPPDGGGHGYPYARGPLREPVLRTISAGSSDVHAVVTRNSYGCDVLNTDRIVFLDVDLPVSAEPGLFGRLFRGSAKTEDARIEAESAKIALLEQWQQRHQQHSFRVYRTAGGLRYLLTSKLAAPDDPVVEEAFRVLDVDPNYRRLCLQQQSFRARMTPKPWRCGIDHPPHRFPFPNAWQSQRTAEWHQQYQQAAAGRAVCLHLLDVGGARIADAVVPILAEHDRLTRAASGLALA